MKIICILLLVLLFKNASSQIVVQDCKSKEMQKFMTTKTMFVLFGKKDFDDALKAAVTKYWKITPFAFINTGEVDSKIEDESLSFLTNVEYVRVSMGTDSRKSFIDQDMQKSSQIAYSLICGGRKSLEKYKSYEKDQIGYFNSEVGSVQQTGINGSKTVFAKNDEAKNSIGGARLDIRTLDFAIRGMNDGLEAVNKNKISGSDDKVRDAVFEYYSSRAPILKNKTLLIDEVNTIDRGPHMGAAIDVNALKIQGIKYAVKTKKEISDLIESADPNYCLYNWTMALGFFYYVLDLETKETVYAAFDQRNMTFEKKAIEKFGDKVYSRK